MVKKMETIGDSSKQPDIAKYFKNYALELYGASVLESEKHEKLGLKTIFDKIFEHQFLKYDIDSRFETVLSKSAKNLQAQFTEQLTEEIEEMQLQINNLGKK